MLLCVLLVAPVERLVSNTEPALMSGATAVLPVPQLPPAMPLSLKADAARIVEGEFRNADTFAAVMRQAGVDATQIDTVANAIEGQFDVQKIRAGRPYGIYFDDRDELLLFRYLPDRQTEVLIAEGKDGWSATEVVMPYDVRPRFVHANVRGSLEGAIAATWVSRRDATALARKLADIFAWNIDFTADLRIDDSIDVVVEQRFLSGEFVGFGDVLAAELSVNGLRYRAVRYQRPAAFPAYFTPTGESLQRAFLRSPVDYSRISSRFSYRRMHPVLNVVRPHLGVDYVAPAGTPVHATSDGVVTVVGRNSQAGNHVKIRHQGSYTSGYLHLQSFATGLSVGADVEQGEVIGYVGDTGLVTNTHLHYTLERGGEYVDPLQVAFPTAAPLPAAHMAVFAQQRDNWMSLLRRGQLDVPSVEADGSG